MCKNTVERARPQITIWRIHIACWVTKATNPHSEYVTHTAFPLQQKLQERTSLLHYSLLPVLLEVEESALYDFDRRQGV